MLFNIISISPKISFECVFTFDIALFTGLCDGQKTPTLCLTGSKSLTPGEDGVQVKLITSIQLRMAIPEFTAA